MKKQDLVRFAKLVPILALVSIIMLVITIPVSGTSITPTFVAGNPTCVGLGYDFGFKVDPPNSGTYTITGLSETVFVSSDGTYFSWTSTLPIDAVIVKGGPNANVFVYDPPAEATHDEGLYSPDNESGGPAGLSHIEFCYDFEVEVTKTAVTTFTRTWHWTIDKSVTPGTLNMFTGDSGEVTYTVAVTKTGHTDSAWAVSGQITVHNPAPVAATVTGVSDTISGSIVATVSCPVSFPYELAAGQNLVCSYSSALSDGTSRVNTATATTSGAVGGDSGTANVSFGEPTTVVNGTINVDDTYNNKTWQFSDSGSVTYTRPFTCDAGKGTHNNTATIRETGQSDSASVTVNCYELTVTKTANTALTRTWNWTIDKVADQSQLVLSDGQLLTVNYQVTVNAASVDRGWAASGNISVNNPAPIGAPLLSVSDVVAGGFNATVTCPVTFPYTLPVGQTLNCTYTVALPNANTRNNTATATLQNTNFMGQPSGSTNFTGTTSVNFANATITEVDECVNVSDTVAGVLGTVCAGDAPETFNYSRTFGKNPLADIQLVCGNNTHTNTASFVTNDTSATGSDTATVTANVTCATGCTLTQGYWKTHSHRGPAPYDNGWLAIGAAGADTTFFISGQTYYQVLWTPPRGGNAYYILAHQYIAAKLNILNGASATTAVNNAIAAAEAFFASKTPSSSLTRAQRNNVLSWATTLDRYNNGLIGPGHCSEDSSSAPN